MKVLSVSNLFFVGAIWYINPAVLAGFFPAKGKQGVLYEENQKIYKLCARLT